MNYCLICWVEGKDFCWWWVLCWFWKLDKVRVVCKRCSKGVWLCYMYMKESWIGRLFVFLFVSLVVVIVMKMFDFYSLFEGIWLLYVICNNGLDNLVFECFKLWEFVEGWLCYWYVNKMYYDYNNFLCYWFGWRIL